MLNKSLSLPACAPSLSASIGDSQNSSLSPIIVLGAFHSPGCSCPVCKLGIILTASRGSWQTQLNNSCKELGIEEAVKMLKVPEDNGILYSIHLHTFY